MSTKNPFCFTFDLREDRYDQAHQRLIGIGAAHNFTAGSLPSGTYVLWIACDSTDIARQFLEEQFRRWRIRLGPLVVTFAVALSFKPAA